ncbi:MAG: hypothetical protein IH861_13960 [Chloroflexi bacterium]|nr:hypothetical protein [Chloroflexota bacterium]
MKDRGGRFLLRWAPSLYSRLRDYRLERAHRAWVRSGRTVPSHVFKQTTLKEYAGRFHLDVFIETGTYLGDMVYATRNLFNEIYSIEVSPELYERSRLRFTPYKHIRILKGDSTVVLPELLRRLGRPALFWLDGHYSAGVTGKSDKETPILEELDHIFSHHITGHVVIIDDARKFTGQDDYPTLQQLRQFVSSKGPNYQCEVANDLIRITSSRRDRDA